MTQPTDLVAVDINQSAQLSTLYDLAPRLSGVTSSLLRWRTP